MQENCLSAEQKSALETLPLASAYVPDQPYETPVSPENGLRMGTIWQTLYKPYREERV